MGKIFTKCHRMAQGRGINARTSLPTNEDENKILLQLTSVASGGDRRANVSGNLANNNEHGTLLDRLLPDTGAHAHNRSETITLQSMSADNRPSPEQSGQNSKRRKKQNASKDLESGVDSDVIGDLVGHFGRWQLMMTLLLSLFQVPNTFHIVSAVYQSAKKNFWCKRPPNLENLPVDTWRNLSRSSSNCYQSQRTDFKSFDMNSENFQTQLRSYLEQNNNTSDPLIPCTSWEFESNDNVGNTWASKWDLVCDKAYQLELAEVGFLLGVATGGVVSGYLSDRFGRKRMLFITVSLQTLIGLALYFVDIFEVFIVMRCLLGIVSVAVTYSALILSIECVDGKWRTIAGMYNLFTLPISYMIIAGIACLTQDYKKLQLWIGLPGIFLIFLWFVVPESPRWLLVKGRIAEVSKIVQSIAKFNKRELPPNYESLLKPPLQETTNANFLSLFRTPYLRCVTICFLCIWFTMNLVYYGIVLNMSTFRGNVYLNSALAGLVEIPAIAIAMFIITKVGKKWVLFSTFIGGGIACCCAALTDGKDDKLWLMITFLMIGKFTISAGNTIMPVYTAELYPTVIRNVGVGACNVTAGLALILTPSLNKFGGSVMLTILTCGSLFGGLMTLFAPKVPQNTAGDQI